MSNVENQIHHYAFALFSLYEEKDEQFLNDLNHIFCSFYQEKEIINILSSNNLSKNQRKLIVANIFENNIDQYLVNFLYVLIDNNFIHNVLFVIQDFFRYYNKENDVTFITIRTAFELDQKTIDKIVESFQSKFNKEIVYKVKLDKSLIGGFKVTCNNDIIYDYSIKGKIEHLKNQIKNTKGE